MDEPDAGIFFTRKKTDPGPLWDKGRLWTMEAQSAHSCGEVHRALYSVPRAGEYLLKAYIAHRGFKPPAGAELESSLIPLMRGATREEQERLTRAREACRRLFQLRWRGVYEDDKKLAQELKNALEDLEVIYQFVSEFYSPEQGGSEA